ncbi:MAG: 4-(cytidine 5'-diphospho)-2-C-methyl-D-erythritol kinase [Thermodesulfovibrionales bacterium]|nr:4-(cytidine 5'-diphospho)-2-C-methyl-D-erythritol kinase [Thermodesulfovibrionales bacterium]
MKAYKSPAKINWYLRVLNKREDGFHNIETIMQTVGLFDEMTFEPSSDVEVLMTPSLGLKMEENLVFKTVLKVKELFNSKKGIRIHIKKQIPSGAGLGGGSSNAATTIVALTKMWGLDVNFRKLYEIAQSIGSDVPFFLYSPIAIVKGRGEVIETFKIKHSYKIMIVKPDISISTSWAYSQLQRSKDFAYHSHLQLFKRALIEADWVDVKKHGINDFEGVIFSSYPEFAEIKDGLLGFGARYALMSGSGSSIYAVFEGEGYKEAFDFYSDRFSTWIVDTLINPVYNIGQCNTKKHTKKEEL